MKISCVIPTRNKRKEELKHIVSYITPFFDEVIIPKDIGNQVYTRFEGIVRASNDIIYTQDDDCIIGNIKELISLYEKDTIIANADNASINKYKDTKICLIGYGAIFNKSLIGKMEDFRVKLGDDDLFNREADRIFTWLNKKKTILGNIKNFPSAYQGISAKSEHEDYLKRIIIKLKEYESLYSNKR